MAKVKVLIVEDELLIAEDLAAWLEDYGFEVTGIASTGNQAFLLYKKNKPDVMLIDIELDGEMDGVELAHMINQTRPIPFIFLSGNFDPVTLARVKHTNPSNFIVKPFEEQQLSISIDMAIANFASSKTPLTPQIEPEKTGKENENYFLLKDRIFIKNRNKRVRIMITDILYVKADNQYADLFTMEGRHTLGFTLNHSLEKLDHPLFCRVSKSYIVNLNYVEGLGYGDNSLFINEQEIRIGAKFKDEFLRRLRRL